MSKYAQLRRTPRVRPERREGGSGSAVRLIVTRTGPVTAGAA